MPTTTIDGIATRYETFGSGPALLMYAPGGFDATVEKWSSQSVYARIRLLDHLPQHYTCIAFDRRECGQSGGRVEHVTWMQYVNQGRGLLDHLGVDRAHLIGGCMGVCPVTAFAVAHPERVISAILYWPVGGARYRLNGEQRFAEHVAYVAQHGLEGVVNLVAETGKPFGADPRGGPWATVIKNDLSFARDYARLNLFKYKLMVSGMQKSLLDRDTAPGAEPEDLLRLDIPALVVPGNDASHAASAARYLQECIPNAEYVDLPVADQDDTTIPQRVLEFLRKADRS